MTRVLDGGSEWESKLLENVVSTTCGEADGHLSHVSHAARGEQNTNCTHFCTHFPHSRRPALAHIKVPSPHSQSAHARVRASAPEALSREDKDGFRELGVLKAATVHQESRVLRRLECGGNKEILAGESLFRKRFLATASRVSCSPKFNANEPCRHRFLSPLPLAADSKLRCHRPCLAYTAGEIVSECWESTHHPGPASEMVSTCQGRENFFSMVAMTNLCPLKAGS
jgi:hypothetical protein